jgi:hypothetical protein
MTLIAPFSRPAGALSDMAVSQRLLSARARTWLQ